MSKAVTIIQPYPALIVSGKKRIETRSWKTNYRGELYIHAAKKKIPKEYRENKDLMLLAEGLEMQYGKIIGKCNLVDCVPMTPEFIAYIAAYSPTEHICGFYEPGRYAWILDNVEPVDGEYIKGKLGIWNF